jgi:hypothetical protein
LEGVQDAASAGVQVGVFGSKRALNRSDVLLLASALRLMLNEAMTVRCRCCLCACACVAWCAVLDLVVVRVASVWLVCERLCHQAVVAPSGTFNLVPSPKTCRFITINAMAAKALLNQSLDRMGVSADGKAAVRVCQRACGRSCGECSVPSSSCQHSSACPAVAVPQVIQQQRDLLSALQTDNVPGASTAIHSACLFTAEKMQRLYGVRPHDRTSPCGVTGSGFVHVVPAGPTLVYVCMYVCVSFSPPQQPRRARRRSVRVARGHPGRRSRQHACPRTTGDCRRYGVHVGVPLQLCVCVCLAVSAAPCPMVVVSLTARVRVVAASRSSVAGSCPRRS